MTKTLGVPVELKDDERGVALDPHAVAMLTDAGPVVLVECGSGTAAGFPDAEYQTSGAVLVSNVDEVWGADLLVKAKEPLASEWKHFRPGLTLLGYLHFAAAPELARALKDPGVEAHAFEIVGGGRGLPRLAPMNDVAGRSGAIMGGYYSYSAQGPAAPSSGAAPAYPLLVSW